MATLQRAYSVLTKALHTKKRNQRGGYSLSVAVQNLEDLV